jgi:hypothetical protein
MPKPKNVRFSKVAPAQIYIDVAGYCDQLLEERRTLRKEEILAELGYSGANIRWDHILWMLRQVHGHKLGLLAKICHSPKLFTRHCTICQKEFQGMYNQVRCNECRFRKWKERRANAEA